MNKEEVKSTEQVSVKERGRHGQGKWELFSDRPALQTAEMMTVVQKVVAGPPFPGELMAVPWKNWTAQPTATPPPLIAPHHRSQPRFADDTLCLLITLSSMKYFFLISLNLLLILTPVLANGRLQHAA